MAKTGDELSAFEILDLIVISGDLRCERIGFLKLVSVHLQDLRQLTESRLNLILVEVRAGIASNLSSHTTTG